MSVCVVKGTTHDVRGLLLGALAPGLAALFIAYSLHRSGVDLRDIAVFGGYLVLGLILPGTVMWRILVSDRSWSLLADLTCGMSLAYAVELGTYLVLAHFDHPRFVVLWPLVPLALTLAPRFRARVWRRSDVVLPRWLSWTVSALVVYAVADTTRSLWMAYPIDGPGARSQYIDIPYHLSLIGALSRHAPVDVPAVAGEPLYYHWFVHAELAATHHISGIESFVLLTRLGPLAMLVLVIAGTAALAHRLTSSTLGAAVAAVALCAGTALPTPLGPPLPFLGGYMFLSPTTVFATALLIAAVAVSLILLHERPPRALPLWAVLAVSLGALSGAKGTVLPLLFAGYLTVLAMTAILERRLHRAALGAAAITVVWFLLAQHFVYGGSSQGTTLKVFGLGSRLAATMGLTADGPVTFGVAGALTLTYLIAVLPLAFGIPGLVTAGVWRDPRAHFLVAAALAAVGAVIVFNNDGFNQVYFFRVAPGLIALASGWGLVSLLARFPGQTGHRIAAISFLVSLALAFAATRIGRTPSIDATVTEIVVPAAVLVALVLLAAAVIGAGSGTPNRGLAILLAICAALGALGVRPLLARTYELVSSPQDQFAAQQIERRPVIGVGGIRAARWLRDHSDADDVVATNVHCRYPRQVPCDHRITWVAGFTERQALLEGWAYTSRTTDEAERTGVPPAYVDYWRPRVLSDNDLTFTDPTPARAERLQRRYGVDWLFVDKRHPADVAGLRTIATKSYEVGQYLVLRLS